MNQINFEMFEIKQKVGQSMKRLQQEFDPIIKSLKEKTDKKEKEERKNPEVGSKSQELNKELNNKKELLDDKNKTEILLEQESIRSSHERLQQELIIMKSQFINLSNENQILKKRLDIISKRIPFLLIFHLITFGLILLIFFNNMPSNRKQEIYYLYHTGENYIYNHFKYLFNGFNRLWYQFISRLNNQYYY
ncbi:hypothetical protein BCR32DRAFT_246226 [Anaeromyces robustus]|uniref:Uncharacterized protein n=1 Tax=Anaeromyces robustus TaxID=1754192 RepID=A0A1Y1X1H3_9FUNG|nr:hypothetical protein BCR32DRAFT_246226 [Anaeromyces robustus]|eukprot:ORX79623.1 hypothetical protein BCR32DRAFT_246226 [Anaeromyces robustus]